MAGRTLTGTNWDGKNAAGQIVPPGNYTATLTATNSAIPNCSATASVVVTVLYCDVKITDFTSNKPKFNPGAGDTVSFNRVITGTYDSAEITVAGRTLSDTAWDGKDSFGQLVPPGIYTVTLKAKNSAIAGCEDTASVAVEVVKTPNSCALKSNLGSSANLASGGLSDSRGLFSLPGPVLSIDLTLYYDSTDPYPGHLGSGWSHSYDLALTAQTNGDVLIRTGSDSYRYYKYLGGVYQPPTGDYSILSHNGDDTYTLTKSDGQRYLFSATGQLASITDRIGNTMQFAYSGNQLTSITDQVGRVTNLAYDANDKLAAITTPDGRVYSLTVVDNHLTRITYPGGGHWDYTYDSHGFLKSKSDPLGNLTSYTYDNNFRVLSATDPEGRVRSVNYPSGSDQVKSSDLVEKDGGVWRKTYDTATGFLQSKTDPQGNTTNYTYDDAGNTLTETGPDGAVTSHTYDSAGNALSTTDPDGVTTSYTYNALNQITSSTDGLGGVSRSEYDGQGNLLSSTDQTGATTSYAYDSLGRITSVTNPLGGVTRMVYDIYGNLAATTDPSGAVTSMTYDLAGRILTQTNPAGGVTTFTYDAAGNLASTTDPQGNVTSSTYDAIGNRLSQTDANGHTTRYEFNSQGQIIKNTDALGGVTQYTYGGSPGCATCTGGVDRLTALTDPLGRTTSYSYDTLGHLLGETDPLGQTSSSTYNNTGRLQTKTDRNGKTITYGYTPGGRLARISYPGGAQTTFTYDQRGSLSLRHDSLGPARFTYDAVGRPTQTSDANYIAIGYQYDAAGNMTKLTYPDGKTVSYTYDTANRLATVRADWLGQTATYSYDSAGRLEQLQQFNGTVVEYGYDSANRLTDLRNLTGAGGSVIAAYHFTLDGNGNRVGADQDVPLLPVISGAGSQDYTYNPQKNRLLSAGTDSFTYDNEGQLATGYGKVYSFDYEHRLVGTVSDTYAYDGAGNRLKATRNGAITKYIYDARGNVIAEARSNNLISRYYIYGAGLLALATPTGEAYCYHFDATGHTVALTDTNKAIVNAYAYEPFGTISQAQEAIAQPFKYVGQYGVMAEQNGLYYMRARYYDPKVRRFISEDPIGFAGGDWNLFGYSGGSPVMRVDPTGLFSEGGSGSNYKGHVDFTGGDNFDYYAEDRDPNTSPYTDPERHFRPLYQSEKDVADAISVCSKKDFGRAMHRAQDFFSHYKQGYRWAPFWFKFGHLFAGSTPDQNMDEWIKAEQYTKGKVEEWNKKCGCQK